ncbi:TolB family protein [Gemmatimonadota bacterium]
MKTIGCVVSLVYTATLLACQANTPAKLTGEYLGQERPGITSQLFAPDFVSTQYGELNSVFTDKGREFYFSRRGMPEIPSAIMVTGMHNDIWTEPEVVTFSGIYSDIDLFIPSDGRRMIFCSNRPLETGGQAKQDHDFWISNRVGKVWDEPVLFAPAALSPFEDYYPIITNSGNLYFNSQREGQGTNNIFCSKWMNGSYAPAVKLLPPINSAAREYDAYVSPDENLIVFSSERQGGFGSSDIYISRKLEDGRWSEPRNLGPDINSETADYGAMISSDGEYFFYTSGKRGNSDIYWVDIKVLNK